MAKPLSQSKRIEAALREEIAALKLEASRLRHEITKTDEIVEPCSDEPSDTKLLSNLDHVRIYIVWTVGMYANGVRLLDIRGVTFSKAHAITWSKILRRDKSPSELWTRVVIEPRVANHLYAEKLREFMVNTGKM